MDMERRGMEEARHLWLRFTGRVVALPLNTISHSSGAVINVRMSTSSPFYQTKYMYTGPRLRLPRRSITIEVEESSVRWGEYVLTQQNRMLPFIHARVYFRIYHRMYEQKAVTFNDARIERGLRKRDCIQYAKNSSPWFFPARCDVAHLSFVFGKKV